MLRLTFRIRAGQHFNIIFLQNLRWLVTYRADFRNFQRAAAGQILTNLGNDHVGFIDHQFIPKAQFQTLHNADIVNTRPRHCCSLQLNRLKNGNRIDKPGARRTPFHL